MKFLSVCSGIEAASVAWQPLGWKAVAFSEIEPFPCALLKHHYPNTPNWGDMNNFKDWPDVSIDLLCGGTPCQSFSVAGLRKGLDDPRGNLMLTFGAIAAKYRPKWLVWENVPGVLSSNNGRDFGAFLGMLGQLGYGFAYRVLDAQYFGVAQRRRRVFVVGCLGDWHSAAAVLFERHSMSGHPAPRREAGQGTARGVEIGPAGGSFTDLSPTLDTRAKDGPVRNQLAGAMMDLAPTIVSNGDANSGFRDERGLVLVPHADISPALKARDGKGPSSDGDGDGDGAILVPMLAHALRGEGFDASEDGTGRGTPLVPVAFAENSRHELRLEGGDGQRTGALSTGGGKPGQGVPMIAFPANLSGTQCASTEDLAPSMGALNPTAVAVALRGRDGGATAELGDEVGHCLRASSGGGDKPHVLTAMQVRRLTPEECERLQGFPTVSEKITIEACLDHQNQSVRVALKCLRWQNSALSAEESALTQPAKTAAVPSSTSPAHLAPLAALHVRMHSVDELLEIRSAGRLIWSASGAGQSERSLPPTLTENSVQELARLLREAARTITAGKAASPPSISLSFPASSGATSAEKFGRETEVSASGAMNDQSRGMFTTSDLGLITMYSGSTVETLCCSALRAIAGCIPNKTLPETFSIELTVETPYTAIPHRGKPAADGNRYKALGNSWAVPNVTWIGRRIEAVQKLKTIRQMEIAA